MRVWALVSVRFFCKFLAIVSVSFFSLGMNWNLYSLFFLITSFIVELLFLRRLTETLEVVSLIIFTSVINLISCFLTPAKFWLFLIFLVCDIFTVVSIFITSFVIGVILPSVLFFSANIFGFLAIKKIIKSPTENLSLFVKEESSKITPGTITYLNGVFLSSIRIGEDYFYVSLAPLRDRDTISILIFLIPALPFFVILFSIYRTRFYRTEKTVDIGGSAGTSKDGKAEESLVEPHILPHKYMEEYIHGAFGVVKDAVSKDVKVVREFSEKISFYAEVFNQREKDISVLKEKLLSCIQDAKKILSGDFDDFSRRVEDFRQNVSDYGVKLNIFYERFLRNFYLELIGSRGNVELWIGRMKVALQEFEHLFHEIISPLGGVENWYSTIHSESPNLLKKLSIIHRMKEKFEIFISKYSDFALSLKEISESINMLYLNSQIIAHKIRAKVPGFDILSSAIKDLVDKIEDDLEHAKNMESVLREIYGFLDHQMKFEDFDVKHLEDGLALLQKIKSSVDNLTSITYKVIASSVDSFGIILSELSEFVAFVSSISQIFPPLMYYCNISGIREIDWIHSSIRNMQEYVKLELGRLLENLSAYAGKKL